MKLSLSRLALIAWLAWLLMLVMMVWLSFSRMLHPSFLYMAIPLVVQLLCTVAVFGGGIWRMIRGPRRLRAAFWLWFGMLPTFWTAAGIEYVLHSAEKRNHPMTLLDRLTAGAGAISSLIGEPYVRVCYPHRYEGERFVMWSDALEPDCKQMAAMDAHIRAMEESLGGRSDYKVYWVRGPIWGINGRYIFGWSLGANPKTPEDGDDGLNCLDRHEVAHFVLDQLAPRIEEIPALLTEGWAEVNSGRLEFEADKRRFLSALHEKRLVSLKELTSTAWYHNSNGPVYPQGCIFVDFLLRQFGPKKFLELCRTCRQDTFPDDVNRVLGMNLDHLDQAYRNDFVQQVSTKRLLLTAKLGEGVDPKQWREFVDDYCAGAKRLLNQFGQSSVTMVQEIANTNKEGITTTDEDRCVYYNDNDRNACLDYRNDCTTANIRTPEREFSLIKVKADDPWLLQNCVTRDRRPDNTTDISLESLSFDHPFYLDMPLEPICCQSYVSSLTISETNLDDPESHHVRISLESTYGETKKFRQRGSWELDPSQNYGLVEEKFEIFNEMGKPTRSWRTTVEYETIDGKPVPMMARTESNSQKRTVKIESCKFGPPSPKVFELATYGNFNPNDPKPLPEPPLPTLIGILTWSANGWTMLGVLVIFGWILIKHFAESRQNTSNSVVGKMC